MQFLFRVNDDPGQNCNELFGFIDERVQPVARYRLGPLEQNEPVFAFACLLLGDGTLVNKITSTFSRLSLDKIGTDRRCRPKVLFSQYQPSTFAAALQMPKQRNRPKRIIDCSLMNIHGRHCISFSIHPSSFRIQKYPSFFFCSIDPASSWSITRPCRSEFLARIISSMICGNVVALLSIAPVSG